jgi:hypothetical protein
MAQHQYLAVHFVSALSNKTPLFCTKYNTGKIITRKKKEKTQCVWEGSVNEPIQQSQPGYADANGDNNHSNGLQQPPT